MALKLMGVLMRKTMDSDWLSSLVADKELSFTDPANLKQ